MRPNDSLDAMRMDFLNDFNQIIRENEDDPNLISQKKSLRDNYYSGLKSITEK